MFCVHCGASNPDLAKFCNECGTALPAQNGPLVSGQTGPVLSSRHRRWVWPLILFFAVGLAVSSCFLISKSRTEGSGEPFQGAASRVATTSAQTTTQEGAAQTTQPPFVPVLLHPYDLLQNPFSYKDKEVWLDVSTEPIFLNGQILKYVPTTRQTEISLGTGLQFQRMLSESEALYAINGLDADTNYNSSMLGQLIVIAAPSPAPPTDEGSEWLVEPLGLAQGTNAFGAGVSVPLIRFVRYSTVSQANPDSHDAQCVSCPVPGLPLDILQKELQGTEVEIPKDAIETLKITVLPDGTVGPNVEIVKSVGHDFDEKAVQAVRLWRFRPATDPDGNPIAASVSLDIDFHGKLE